MRANLTSREKQALVDMLRISTDEVLSVLWKTITANAGGISGMDPDLLKAFYDEFDRRPGLLESIINESKRRNTMRLTERQLKRIIKEEYSKLIKESSLPKMDRSMMRRLYDWISINEEIGDPQTFLGTIDTFFEAERDAEMPVDGMEEEVHQALNDLIDLGIVSGQDDPNALLGLLVQSWREAEGIIEDIESYENEIN